MLLTVYAGAEAYSRTLTSVHQEESTDMGVSQRPALFCEVIAKRISPRETLQSRVSNEDSLPRVACLVHLRDMEGRSVPS